jgi:alkylation response protein AidB-like acyl-CoA dehydrogenase
VTDLAGFQRRAADWLAASAGDAPPDYGAICPPHLVDRAVAWHRRIHEAGFAGLHWPVEHGGRGLSREHTAIWQYECARAGVPAAFNMVGLVLTAQAVMSVGTPEQRRDHLPATVTADRLWCQLFSEPGSGSDLASLSTTAEIDGDDFVVNGQKVWCSGGRYSHWGILLVRTDRDARRHRGISFVLVDMSTPGIEVRPLRQMTGDAEFDEVFFTDARIPTSNLLGPLHDGWGVAMSVLTDERSHIATAVVGLERRLRRITELADGHDLDAVRRQRLAALVANGTSLRCLAGRQGPVATTAASLLKLGITEMNFDAAVLGVDRAGPSAMLMNPDSTALLSAPGGRIAGGTSQVQRSIIGERLLGLPREPGPHTGRTT